MTEERHFLLISDPLETLDVSAGSDWSPAIGGRRGVVEVIEASHLPPVITLGVLRLHKATCGVLRLHKVYLGNTYTYTSYNNLGYLGN